MGTAVGADTSGLRAAADELARSQLSEVETASAELIGSPRAVEVFRQFDAYWKAGRDGVAGGVGALARVARSTADAYEGRDAQSAGAFGVGARAF